MSSEQLERLSYGLLLLQEILQGYDNNNYRTRTLYILMGVKNSELTSKLMLWASRGYSTSELLTFLENLIERSAK